MLSYMLLTVHLWALKMFYILSIYKHVLVWWTLPDNSFCQVSNLFCFILKWGSSNTCKNVQSAKKDTQQMNFGTSFWIWELFTILTFGSGHNLSMKSVCDYWSETSPPFGQDLAFVVWHVCPVRSTADCCCHLLLCLGIILSQARFLPCVS